MEKSDETIKFGNNLTKNLADDARALLDKYKEVCYNVPGLTGRVKYEIRTGVHQPFKSAPYKISQAFQDQVRTELKTRLEMGIITPSKSPWSSPLITVTKKCGDYRLLNYH